MHAAGARSVVVVVIQPGTRRVAQPDLVLPARLAAHVIERERDAGAVDVEGSVEDDAAAVDYSDANVRKWQRVIARRNAGGLLPGPPVIETRAACAGPAIPKPTVKAARAESRVNLFIVIAEYFSDTSHRTPATERRETDQAREQQPRGRWQRHG